MTGEADERADFELFAASNQGRLLQVYDEFAAGRGWPLCWPGLLAPQAWFLYRKMYLWAALVSAGPMLIAFVPQLWLLTWGANIVGAAGLPLYLAGARRTIDRIRAGAAVEAPALIARAGGVSWIGAAIGLVFAFAGFVLSVKSGAAPLLAPK